LGEVAQAVLDYKQRVEEGGCQPPTYAADISSMMESLSKAAKSERGGTFTQHSRQRDSRQQAACAMAAGWLCSQALAVVQASHADHCCIDNNSNNPRLPIQDLCALAYRLPDFIQTLPSGASIIPLARSIAELAAVYIEQGDAPPIVRSWCDLLYGLTKAGLVVNMEVNASPVAVKQHSPRLQQLMDEGAQRLPALLASQGAVAQDVSLTLLAYAYAGYTGDLGPVTQALASNMEGCLQGAYAQNVSNTLWALGKLCEMEHQKLAPADAKQQPSTQPGAYSQELFSYALGELHSNLEMAKPQGVSNAVYGCALAGHVEGVPQLLDSVCQQPQVMARAKPQEWSNIVWAAATLHEAAASQGHTEGLARRLRSCGQLLMGTLVEEPQVMARAKPQNWSNIVWAAAKLGCVEQGSVLLQQLARQPQVMTQAIPQHWSNTLWAAATLHQIAVDTTTNTGVIDMLRKGGHPLLQACASSPTALKGANSQDWSNTLWAAAVLHWYDQHLFSQGAAALAAMPPAKVKPQAVSNALYACALCAHWDGNVQQLLGRVNEYDLAAFAPQALANALYAWSVLSCAVAASGAEQQRTQALSTAAAALLQEAASRPVSSFLKEGLWQLYAAHLYAQHLGIPGLPAGTVLEAARAAGWSDGTHSISASQEEVARALQQLGYTVQVEMKSPDGLMSVDVGVTALPGGSPCSIAVEFDGPYHYVTEYSGSGSVRERLDGPTRLRNTFLHARFPDGLVCIPWKEWVAVTKDDQQEEYIMRAMAKVLESKVRTGPCLFGSYVLHVMTVQHCSRLVNAAVWLMIARSCFASPPMRALYHSVRRSIAIPATCAAVHRCPHMDPSWQAWAAAAEAGREQVHPTSTTSAGNPRLAVAKGDLKCPLSPLKHPAAMSRAIIQVPALRAPGGPSGGH
jgi:hypothetical protein